MLQNIIKDSKTSMYWDGGGWTPNIEEALLIGLTRVDEIIKQLAYEATVRKDAHKETALQFANQEQHRSYWIGRADEANFWNKRLEEILNEK